MKQKEYKQGTIHGTVSYVYPIALVRVNDKKKKNLVLLNGASLVLNYFFKFPLSKYEVTFESRVI